MGLFTSGHDARLATLYEDARRLAADSLQLAVNHVVLDVPCGYGQSFGLLAPKLVGGGELLGVDLSEARLKRAQASVTAAGWQNVKLARLDVADLTGDELKLRFKRSAVNRVHCFLGLTAFPHWQVAFDCLWSVLAPGGRFVIVDVYEEKPSLQGRWARLVSRSDPSRRVWEGLQRNSQGFSRVDLPSVSQHGGQLFLAAGMKPMSLPRPG